MGKYPNMADTIAELDDTDRLILQELQQDASMSIAEIAAKVSLSHNASWRRMKRLEDVGVITAKVAVLDPDSLGLGLTVFVAVKAAEHSDAWQSKFAKGVSELPQVLEVHRLSGDMDYLLKVCARSIADYDQVYRRLIAIAPMAEVRADFAMEKVKFTTALPVTRDALALPNRRREPA
jgi:Lrp/AsnC family transcriptional regulator